MGKTNNIPSQFYLKDILNLEYIQNLVWRDIDYLIMCLLQISYGPLYTDDIMMIVPSEREGANTLNLLVTQMQRYSFLDEG